MKFSANASPTASKPRLTCPSTVGRSSVAMDITPPRRRALCGGRKRLRTFRDTKQLLSLHDEVNDADDDSGQQQWQSVESIARSATGAHEKTSHAGRHLVERERPRHLRRAIRRQPAKRQHALGI